MFESWQLQAAIALTFFMFSLLICLAHKTYARDKCRFHGLAPVNFIPSIIAATILLTLRDLDLRPSGFFMTYTIGVIAI